MDVPARPRLRDGTSPSPTMRCSLRDRGVALCRTGRAYSATGRDPSPLTPNVSPTRIVAVPSTPIWALFGQEGQDGVLDPNGGWLHTDDGVATLDLPRRGRACPVPRRASGHRGRAVPSRAKHRHRRGRACPVCVAASLFRRGRGQAPPLRFFRSIPGGSVGDGLVPSRLWGSVTLPARAGTSPPLRFLRSTGR